MLMFSSNNSVKYQPNIGVKTQSCIFEMSEKWGEKANQLCRFQVTR